MTYGSIFVMLWACLIFYMINKRIDLIAEHFDYVGENRERLIKLEQKCQCKPLKRAKSPYDAGGK